jgi:hypothetical protein
MIDHGSNVTVEYHFFELAPDLPADYLSSEADFLQFHHRDGHGPRSSR